MIQCSPEISIDTTGPAHVFKLSFDAIVAVTRDTLLLPNHPRISLSPCREPFRMKTNNHHDLDLRPDNRQRRDVQERRVC